MGDDLNEDDVVWIMRMIYNEEFDENDVDDEDHDDEDEDHDVDDEDDPLPSHERHPLPGIKITSSQPPYLAFQITSWG